MKIDPHAYNISVRRGVFDGEALFEARVKELPDVAEYAETYQEAYELAVDTIETAAAAFAEQGRPLPPAQVPADEFSGRVTLRIPRSLHRALAVAADDEGVSLNAHLVGVLTYYSGFAAGSGMRIESASALVSDDAA
ncbi:toxin-antitoxin system HicB family antitoxin [Thiohalocapsa halophila]|uniref:Toxin-antitoxin system HicB family antitoxin n=1 Tax=Thiohalocapsa halophila TaxID=69359 RepID=A0ABS1CG56_9GAMM|nr:toxin-antitoxin system HicB family antitoxin [Thiohalocapsa halophila]MBK1630906.1 toxin-antitoxin system HicB family antitoxin [Thiohalocapsa halophila]